MKVVLDAAGMQYISLFESLSGARVKDCILGESVVFVVYPGEVGKAVGKGGMHVRTLEKKLNKRVRVVEFSEDVLEFAKHVVAPLEIAEAVLEEDVVILTAKDLKTRGMLIGRNASNLRGFEAIVQRYFPVKELKVK